MNTVMGEILLGEGLNTAIKGLFDVIKILLIIGAVIGSVGLIMKYRSNKKSQILYIIKI